MRSLLLGVGGVSSQVLVLGPLILFVELKKDRVAPKSLSIRSANIPRRCHGKQAMKHPIKGRMLCTVSLTGSTDIYM